MILVPPCISSADAPATTNIDRFVSSYFLLPTVNPLSDDLYYFLPISHFLPLALDLLSLKHSHSLSPSLFPTVHGCYTEHCSSALGEVGHIGLILSLCSLVSHF